MELRDYQQEAYSRIRQQARHHKRILLTMPTGAGKTHIAVALINAAAEKLKQSVFLAYSKEVIDQTSSKLHEAGLEHGIIKSGYTPSWSASTQVASIMTLINRDLPPGHLVIVDEAHRATAKTYRDLLAMYPDAFIVGLTASPISPKGKGLGDIFDVLVQGVSMEWLIEHGHLVKTKVFAPSSPDMKGVRINGGDYDVQQMEGRVKNAQLVGDIVDHWLRLGVGKRTLGFAATIAHSNYIVDQFRAVGVKAEHVDGTTPRTKREELFAALREHDIDQLWNVGVAQEGYDEPAIECMVQARPTWSFRFYIQTTGRSLRPYNGKDHALILDHAGNTIRHGFVHEDVDWELEPGASIEKDRRKERERNPAKEWVCSGCFAVNPPPIRGQAICRECGLRRVVTKPVQTKEGKLQELKSAHRKRTTDEKDRIWKGCIAVAVHKGYKAGAAAAIYKSKTGAWPRNLSNMDSINWQNKARAVWPGFYK